MPDRRRAWAAALFASAPDAGRRAAYGEALDAIGLAMAGAEGRALRDFLRDPSIDAARKVEVLAAASAREPGGPDPLFARFCALAVEKGRASLLPAVAQAYRRELDRAEGLCRLEIEAAREPGAAAVERIAAAWALAFGAASVRTTVRVRPELVAGYRLRSGSIMLDYSIAGRAERLARQLARPGAERPAGSPREEG